MRIRHYLIPLAATLLLPFASFAQTGMPSFGSFTQTGIATTNNENLNGIIPIPVVSSSGRGLPLHFSLVYNSQVWRPYLSEGGAYVWARYGGWLDSLTGSVFYEITDNYGTCDRQGDYTQITYYNGYEYQDPLGTMHPFNLSVTATYSSCTDSTTYTGTYTGYATDDSGYYASITNPANSLIPTITSKSGVLISTTAGRITDPNGNFISSGTGGVWTDSADRAVLKTTSSSTVWTFGVLDPNGNYQTTTVNLSATQVKTNFGCSGIAEYSGTQNLPTSVQLPNGQTYTITYESTPGYSGYVTGRVKRITLPTGGYYEYDYIGSNDGTSCSDGSAVDVNEVVSDGTNTATWTFVRNSGGTTITTPQLADTPNAFDTVYTFTGAQATQEKIYKESPGVNVLRTINTTWASNNTPATQVTILEDGSTQSEVDTTYDSNGLLDSVAEYDWGSGSRGNLIRTTTYTYQTSSNYTSRNILDLVTSKHIKDGSGTVQSRQDTSYDDFQIVTCHTGVSQHDDADYPCTMNYRGNPTTVTTYLQPAAPSGGISKTFTYDNFGNLLTAQVNCCQTKSWSYSSATNYSEPDSETSGTSPSLTTQVSYNPYTGQISTSTDPNNLVTHFSFDTLRRPTEIWQTYSGNNVGSAVSYSYDDSHFTSTMEAQIDTANSIQRITALDDLGRPNLVTIEDIHNNVYSEVSTNHDLAGRAYQMSNPYTGSPSHWTTTAFDALGRPAKVTLPDGSVKTYSYSANTTTITDPVGIQRKLITDGAGRLSSVYEPDPASNNSLTLQTLYSYNVLDELTSVTQGSQTRTYVYL